jgi:hypothetical protein
MALNLKPSESLSHVAFIHDYLQLIFQDEWLSIYNLAEVERHGLKVSQVQPGFCDAVRALIGQRVVAADHSDACVLRLSFEEGTQFTVRSDEAAISGPEAFEFNGKNQALVVEQNA